MGRSSQAGIANPGGARTRFANEVSALHSEFCTKSRWLGLCYSQAVRARFGSGAIQVDWWWVSAARLSLIFALLAGCGGKYELPDRQNTEGGDPAPSTGGSAGSSAGGTSGNKGSLPMHELGMCVPGFAHTSDPARSCPWITEHGECFDSFDAACACICPRSGSSLCSGAFAPNASGMTTVYCDKT